MTPVTSHVLVPVARWPRWVENFTTRHGPAELEVAGGRLHGRAFDGSTFAAAPPFGREYAGAAVLAVFTGECAPPEDWGVLLVRKGGFAVARVHGEEVVDSKVGQRHVQGRSKAGGWSQQRFARRRDNQARSAYEAAAEHAARILAGAPLVVTGGDATAVEQVLSDRRLSGVAVVAPFLAVPDPRRAVLEQAVADAASVRVEVENADLSDQR